MSGFSYSQTSSLSSMSTSSTPSSTMPTELISESEYIYSTPTKRPRPYETRTPVPKRIATESDFTNRLCARRLVFDNYANNNIRTDNQNNINDINNTNNANTFAYDINNDYNINNDYDINNTYDNKDNQ